MTTLPNLTSWNANHNLSPFYLDNDRYFANASNIYDADYRDIFDTFARPTGSASTLINGYDWTVPYPGDAISGHSINVTIGTELEISEAIAQNATTILTSLSFGVPDELMDGPNQPKRMDDSWFVCRHIFISKMPKVKQAVDGGKGCSFLPAACQSDLRTSLTENWGMTDDDFMCSTEVFDAIPQSCLDSFGPAFQDVIGIPSFPYLAQDIGPIMLTRLYHAAIDSDFVANATVAGAQVGAVQSQFTWRMGTGLHNPGDPTALDIAENRTYLVATVWGYSSDAISANNRIPDVSFACLSPQTKSNSVGLNDTVQVTSPSIGNATHSTSAPSTSAPTTTPTKKSDASKSPGGVLLSLMISVIACLFLII